MKRWADSTFLFISTNVEQFEGGVEQCWIPVMQALAEEGASVRVLTLMGSPVGEEIRRLGIPVDPYILDKWNLVRSKSRLRKYLRRYAPVAAHSTGIEADLMLRWATRKVAGVRVVHTVTARPQSTRRTRWVDALMRRYDELGMRSSAAVFVDSDELAREVAGAGVAADHIFVAAADEPQSANVRRQMDLYRRFLAG